MTAGELCEGQTFLWWGARFAMTGFVNDPDDPEQTHAGWIEAIYLDDSPSGELDSARIGDLSVFPPDELVQLLDEQDERISL